MSTSYASGQGGVTNRGTGRYDGQVQPGNGPLKSDWARWQMGWTQVTELPLTKETCFFFHIELVSNFENSCSQRFRRLWTEEVLRIVRGR